MGDQNETTSINVNAIKQALWLVVFVTQLRTDEDFMVNEFDKIA